MSKALMALFFSKKKKYRGTGNKCYLILVTSLSLFYFEKYQKSTTHKKISH